MSQLIEQQQSTQVLRTEQPMASSMLEFIQRAASDASVDMDKLERLILMSEKMQAKSAEQSFNAAMAQMQCEIPTVGEGGLNTHTGNSYSTLDDINAALKPIMHRHGFAITFKVDHVGAGVKVTGILMHSAGHREDTTMFLPMDIGKGRNDVQAVGSSVTYARRYVMCALLNITTGETRDDDGVGAVPPALVTEAQARQLQALLDKCSDKAKEAFGKLFGSTADVEKSNFDRVLGQLTKSAEKAGVQA